MIAFLAAASAAPAPAAAPAQRSRRRQRPRRPAPRRGRRRSKRAAGAAGRRRYVPDAQATRCAPASPRAAWSIIGVGGAIDGKVNPVLTAAEGQVVQLTLINGEGAEHDIVFPDQNARSPRVTGKGASTTIAFRADARPATSSISAAFPGHRLAGMEGQFVVTPRPPRADRGRGRHLARSDRPAAADRQARAADGARRSRQPSKSKAGSRTARPSATGPSTARCPVRSSACASATPSTST